jgi:hypothetical protein
MSSLQSETARANGAKSRGPVTPEGRAASSRNSLRHGFTAASVVLPTESSEDFQALLDSYTQQFHPQGGVEIDLIQTMAAARWRLRRISTIETTLLNNEMTRHAKDCRRELNNPDDHARLAWVFQKLADHGQSLALLMRYEGALNRSYDRAFKQLLLLQSARHRAQPNEPKPDPMPTPVTSTLLSRIPASNASDMHSEAPGRRRACPPLPGSELGTDPTPTSPPAPPQS